MKKLSDCIRHFYDNEMQFSKVLFPLPKQKTKKRIIDPNQSVTLFDGEKIDEEIQPIDFNNDNGGSDNEEEEKGDGPKRMPNDQRYYLFRYFEINKEELA